MRKIAYSITLFLIVSLNADLLSARPQKFRGWSTHRSHKYEGPDVCFGDHEYLRERLNITDKQIEKISEINKKYMQELMQYKEKIEPQKIKLKSLLLSENIDLQDIRSTLKKISNLKVEIRFLRIKQRLEIEKILTPSQRERLRNERIERRDRRKKRAREQYDGN